MQFTDTIAAISSGVGPAARMIVRLTGDRALPIAQSLAEEAPPASPAACRSSIRLGQMSVPCWLYCFAAPRSYTGHDLVEFHIPGNPLLARMVLDALVSAGARQAEAGEFTARAYFNGRLDLTQAEGVAAMVSAANEGQLRAAQALLAGELPRRLAPIMDRLANLLARVEAQIDFADEGIADIPASEITHSLALVREQLHQLVRDSGRFERLTHEPRIVLTGRPNAGKSTLLNALAGSERAIISPLAGTTRDVLTATATLRSGQVTVIDAAGLEDQEVGNDIDAQMQTQARAAIASADVIVQVQELADTRPAIQLPRQPDLMVRTKCDLHPRTQAPDDQLFVSAQHAIGMDRLRDALDRLAFGDPAAEARLALNARHLAAIGECQASIGRIDADLPAEVVALELREGLDALGGILGQMTPDDILGRVFASFCIGK